MFMMLVIVVNVAFMAIVWYDQPAVVNQMDQYANYVFTAIFTVRTGRAAGSASCKPVSNAG